MKPSETDRNVPRPRLTTLDVGDDADQWEALGFAVADGAVELGGVTVRLGAPSLGISSWAIHGLPPSQDVDGLPTAPASTTPRPNPVPHPNGATGLDHIVITTPDFDRTAKALEAVRMPLRRIRDAGGFRQGFRRLGPAILELVEAQDAPPDAPARFWGLVVIVADVDELKRNLGDVVGDPKPAVQPGRRIVTLRQSAGLGQPVAFISPERE
jgi:sensor domain CHASE-containing protein